MIRQGVRLTLHLTWSKLARVARVEACRLSRFEHDLRRIETKRFLLEANSFRNEFGNFKLSTEHDRMTSSFYVFFSAVALAMLLRTTLE